VSQIIDDMGWEERISPSDDTGPDNGDEDSGRSSDLSTLDFLTDVSSGIVIGHSPLL